MALRLPYYSRSKNKALLTCIERAAARAGWTPGQMAVAMGYFFEELVDQICKGRAVSIPGFGLFGAKTWIPRKEGCAPSAYVAFSSARGFREQATAEVPTDCEATRAMVNHRRSHHISSRSTKRDRSKERPAKALARFREVAASQLRAQGLPVPGE